MTLIASAHSSGDTLRQDVLIDGRHRLTTDEPPRLGGTDRGPAPHELVPAALAPASQPHPHLRTHQRLDGR